MPPTKCLLNGNGRIGRLLLRYAWEDPTLDIVHINDLCSCESAAYLIKYDSVHGTWNKDVKCLDDTTILIDGKTVTFSQAADLSSIPVAEDVEMVMECTGKFLKVATLQPYFDRASIKQVVVSAPVKEAGALNVVLGCNHQKFLADHANQKIITNASCTTNCLAPVVKVIQENFGIKHGCITTIHVSKTQTTFLVVCRLLIVGSRQVCVFLRAHLSIIIARTGRDGHTNSS